MHQNISKRVLEVSNYFISNNSTVRATAKALGLSKTTVHIDLTERLRYVSPTLVETVRKILKTNIDERHNRGGESTRLKFMKLKEHK